jgi:hypothetical protein
MSVNRVIGTGLVTLLATAVWGRQIAYQPRSGGVRPRGSNVDKTREENPAYYWSSIALEIGLILTAVYFFVKAIGKT